MRKLIPRTARDFARVAFVAAIVLIPTVVLALLNIFMQEGFVTDRRDRAFDGAYDITVQLFDVAQGGVAFFEELHEDVEISNGYYAIPIGGVEELDGTVFEGDVWFTIRIDDGDFLEPRIPLGKVPAAFISDLALNIVDTANIDVATVAVGGEVVIDQNGRWVGDPVGLRGAQGPEGERGPQGPTGAPGAAR